MATKPASPATSLPRETMGEREILEMMEEEEEEELLGLSGRETPPLRPCDAMDGSELERVESKMAAATPGS